MRSTSNVLSAKVRAQSVELSNLADAIDLYARLQQTRLIASGVYCLLATHELYDKNSMPMEDYSDLSPSSPHDPTAWRGARFRRLRNAAMADDDAAALRAYAGHGRAASE